MTSDARRKKTTQSSVYLFPTHSSRIAPSCFACKNEKDAFRLGGGYMVLIRCSDGGGACVPHPARRTCASEKRYCDAWRGVRNSQERSEIEKTDSGKSLVHQESKSNLCRNLLEILQFIKYRYDIYETFLFKKENKQNTQ